jgi:glycerol-3-phosphate dehydrogenase
MNKFSTFQRPYILEQLDTQEYDLAIIGGGITGAGIALDASSRGLKVALIEKQDFAAGTSSRSTKLIHGGLRYLKNYEIALVRELGIERAIVYKNAPHLVRPEKMLLPLIKNGTYGKTLTSFGLLVYDFLAKVRRHEYRKMLSKEETLQKEPLLKKDKVIGGGLYYEYRTDDARLTLEIIKTAIRYGATCINYTQALNFTYKERAGENDTQITGITCKDLLTNQEITLKARYIVNASGPWVDTIRKIDQSLNHKHLHLTKGIHIVVPYEKLPLKQAVYFDVADGRMIFAIPRGQTTYIGTTDTNYQGPIETPKATYDDVYYLISSTNAMFENVNLRVNDVISSWAGLRPLIHEEGKSPSELSRKDEIFISPSGLISIAGGKLTGYRTMAKKVVNIILKDLKRKEGKAFVHCLTKNIIISGGDFNKPAELPKFTQEITQKLEKNGIGALMANYLVQTYGKQSSYIIEIALRYNEPNLELAIARAELWFCVHYEMVVHLHDFFIRRTGKLYFYPHQIETLLQPLLKDMQAYFQWDEATLRKEKEMIEQALEEARNFLPEISSSRI